MSKIGVGVGEDFPLDEGAPPNPSESEPEHEHCHGDRAEAWRQWCEQKRQWHQMRAEWRARRHALRQRLREQFRREGAGEHEWHGPKPQHLAIGILALIGLAALLFHHDR